MLFTTWQRLAAPSAGWVRAGARDVESSADSEHGEQGWNAGSLVFCVAAGFLPVEQLELPYLMLFLGAQLYVVQRAASTWESAQKEATVPGVMPGQLRPVSMPQPSKLHTLPR